MHGGELACVISSTGRPYSGWVGEVTTRPHSSRAALHACSLPLCWPKLFKLSIIYI